MWFSWAATMGQVLDSRERINKSVSCCVSPRDVCVPRLTSYTSLSVYSSRRAVRAGKITLVACPQGGYRGDTFTGTTQRARSVKALSLSLCCAWFHPWVSRAQWPPLLVYYTAAPGERYPAAFFIPHVLYIYYICSARKTISCVCVCVCVSLPVLLMVLILLVDH